MNISRALILAAGVGKRLMPLTKKVPKPLLEIAGIPIMSWSMKHLKSCGVRKIFIVIQRVHEHLFRSKLKDEQVDITYLYQDQPRGMADAILKAKDCISEPFIICAGDMIVPVDHVNDMIAMHQEDDPYGTLSLIKAPVDHVPGLGNVDLDDNKHILRIIEKPAKNEILSNVYSMPFYIFNDDLFTYLEECPVSPRGEKELQTSIQQALNDGHVIKGVLLNMDFSTTLDGFQKELASLNITNKEDYFNSNMKHLDNVGIEKPLDVLCTMIEPVIVKKDCTIADDCLLGPNVIIGEQVTIDALTEASNTIIQDKCKIGKHCYLEYVIIMEGATVPDETEARGAPGDIKIIE